MNSINLFYEYNKNLFESEKIRQDRIDSKLHNQLSFVSVFVTLIIGIIINNSGVLNTIFIASRNWFLFSVIFITISLITLISAIIVLLLSLSPSKYKFPLVLLSSILKDSVGDNEKSKKLMNDWGESFRSCWYHNQFINETKINKLTTSRVFISIGIVNFLVSIIPLFVQLLGQFLYLYNAAGM